MRCLSIDDFGFASWFEDNGPSPSALRPAGWSDAACSASILRLESSKATRTRHLGQSPSQPSWGRDAPHFGQTRVRDMCGPVQELPPILPAKRVEITGVITA